GSGAIGSPLSLTVNADAGDRVLLIISDTLGISVVPGLDGFPLFASPGGQVFLVLPVGTSQGAPINVSAPITDNPAIIGHPVLFQAAIVPQDTSLKPVLTNVVSEVIRDHL